MKLSNERRVGSFVYVFDIKGGGLAMITPAFLRMTKAYVKRESMNYPQRIGSIFIVRPPFMFSSCFSLVKPWISDAVAKKIHICEDESALSELIDEEQLPGTPESRKAIGFVPASYPGFFLEPFHESSESDTDEEGSEPSIDADHAPELNSTCFKGPKTKNSHRVTDRGVDMFMTSERKAADAVTAIYASERSKPVVGATVRSPRPGRSSDSLQLFANIVLAGVILHIAQLRLVPILNLSLIFARAQEMACLVLRGKWPMCFVVGVLSVVVSAKTDQPPSVTLFLCLLLTAALI